MSPLPELVITEPSQGEILMPAFPGHVVSEPKPSPADYEGGPYNPFIPVWPEDRCRLMVFGAYVIASLLGVITCTHLLAFWLMGRVNVVRLRMGLAHLQGWLWLEEEEPIAAAGHQGQEEKEKLMGAEHVKCVI
ncbi:uncharacterized protein CTHT_0069510 [Thermochaetoides thermophila DSM 1495]|uniref:Uncharacterized protein n=1 Tax=Chaetomium thermophilum (strain DSM 1495 / CBS 144.50 / IMI 039719) TaxID=759272 RepID=G0SHC2_CHATD|nr:hypothetical protein CTHT_0069510 [Thermochaetoides thermophila DSM 1495]EGS17611.1 hypothetical protein CTHT_0069510 [Thermochaetoides thermophila DSM 1495]